MLCNFLVKEESVRKIRVEVGGRFTVQINSELSALLGFGSLEHEFDLHSDFTGN